MSIKDKLMLAAVSLVLLVVPYLAIIGCYASAGLIK
jgi:hypothetical protein